MSNLWPVLQNHLYYVMKKTVMTTLQKVKQGSEQREERAAAKIQRRKLHHLKGIGRLNKQRAISRKCLRTGVI